MKFVGNWSAIFSKLIWNIILNVVFVRNMLDKKCKLAYSYNILYYTYKAFHYASQHILEWKKLNHTKHITKLSLKRLQV